MSEQNLDLNQQVAQEEQGKQQHQQSQQNNAIQNQVPKIEIPQAEEKVFKSKDEVILNRIRLEIKKRNQDVEKEKISLQKAMNHQLANRVGRDYLPEELEPGQELTFCECCARQVQKAQLPLIVDTIELAFLGSAYVSYLEFIKFCAQLLLAFFLTSGLFNIITNSAFGTDCISPTAQSAENKTLIEEECDERDLNAADYTLIISDIPDTFTYEGDPANLDYEQILKEFFSKNLAETVDEKKLELEKKKLKEKKKKQKQKENERKGKKKDLYLENMGGQQNEEEEDEDDDDDIDIESMLKEEKENLTVEIVTVGLCFDLKKFHTLDSNITNLRKKLSRCKTESDKIKYTDVLNRAQTQRDLFSKDYKKLEDNKYKINNFTGHAYVVLQYETDQERISEEYHEIDWITQVLSGQKQKKLTFQQHLLAVTPAPDPKNIFWKNLRHTQGALLVRRSALFVATLLLLGGCLGLLFSFQLIQMKVGAQENKDSIIVSIISFAISISIILLNIGAQQIIWLIAEKEARPTKIGYFDSVVVKQAVAHFLNTSVLLFVIQVFIYTDGDGYGKLFKAGGLAYNMNSIFMTNMVVQNLVQGINIPYYVGKSLQKGFAKLGSENLQKMMASQEALNQYYENPIFNLQVHYSVTISSIFSALFYAPIIPFCLVWTLIQILLKYWVDKYNIIKQSTSNVGPNINLCLDVVENLEYALPIYSFANMVYFIYISQSNEVDSLSVFGVILGLAHAFLPMQYFNEQIYKIESTCNNMKRYEDVCIDFISDYDRENPIKKVQAMKKHYKSLKLRAKVEHRLDDNASILQDYMVESSSPSNSNMSPAMRYSDQKCPPSIFGSRFKQEHSQQSQPDETPPRNQFTHHVNEIDELEHDKRREHNAEESEKLQNNPPAKRNSKAISNFSRFVQNIIEEENIYNSSEKIQQNHLQEEEKTNITDLKEKKKDNQTSLNNSKTGDSAAVQGQTIVEIQLEHITIENQAVKPKYSITNLPLQQDQSQQQQQSQLQKSQLLQNQSQQQQKDIEEINDQALLHLQPYSKTEENHKVSESLQDQQSKKKKPKTQKVDLKYQNEELNYDDRTNDNTINKFQSVDEEKKYLSGTFSSSSEQTKHYKYNQKSKADEVKQKHSSNTKSNKQQPQRITEKAQNGSEKVKKHTKSEKNPLQFSELFYAEEIKLNKSTMSFSPSQIDFMHNTETILKSELFNSRFMSNLSHIPTEQSNNGLLLQNNDKGELLNKVQNQSYLNTINDK